MKIRSFAKDIHGYREKGSIVALTALRIGVGIILVVHGGLKLSDPLGTRWSFAETGIPAPEVAVYLAILGEFFGGLGLLIGFLTPLAALGPACTMAAAIVFVHAGKGLLARSGGWEYPLTLLLVSVYFALRGAGPVSVDALIAKWRQRGRRIGAPTAARGGEPGAAGSAA